jgi:hypothetical protein
MSNDRTDDRKQSTNLTETSGTETRHERNDATARAGDLKDPKQVWSNSETTPSVEDEGADIGHGRVADAGDVDGHATSPYGTEMQADALAKQTDRDRVSGGVEKPKR